MDKVHPMRRSQGTRKINITRKTGKWTNLYRGLVCRVGWTMYTCPPLNEKGGR